MNAIDKWKQRHHTFLDFGNKLWDEHFVFADIANNIPTLVDHELVVAGFFAYFLKDDSTQVLYCLDNHWIIYQAFACVLKQVR